MFVVDAIIGVAITSITISVNTGTSAEVWTKPGNYTGFEFNSSSWTKVGGKILASD